MTIEQCEPRLMLTEVSGFIHANTTWSNTSEPYEVVGPITVSSGARLTIAPGVSVLNPSHTITMSGGKMLANGSSITGGTLKVTDHSTSVVEFKGDVTLNGVAWDDQGAGEFLIPANTWAQLHGDYAHGLPTGATLIVAQNYTGTAGAFGDSELRIAAGDYVNDGRIVVRTKSTGGDKAQLNLLGDVSFIGSGEIHLRNSANRARIVGEPDATLTIGPAQLLHGRGSVFTDMINLGDTVADFPGTPLKLLGDIENDGSLKAELNCTLQVDGNVVNRGTMQANLGATLTLSPGSSVFNVGHTISADAGTVLVTNSTITGGILQVTNDPESVFEFAENVTLNGVAWDDQGAGEFRIAPNTWAQLHGDYAHGLPAGSTLIVAQNTPGTAGDVGDAELRIAAGDYVNDGRIVVRAKSTGTDKAILNLLGDVSFTGSGEIHLRNSATRAQILGAGTTLTVGPDQLLHGRGTVNPDVLNLGYTAADFDGQTLSLLGQVQNDGTLEALLGGTLQVNGTVVNRGALRAIGPKTSSVLSTLDLNGSLIVDDNGLIEARTLGKLQVAGHLLGTTTNSGQYDFLGNVKLDGGGTRLMEVMSQDLGASHEGFLENFAYGDWRPNGTVQLVDNSDNATGTGAEALYVDKLVVKSGHTLDLNGLNVYARTFRVNGTVINGVIQQAPDGGPIPFNRIVSGSISTPGEIDDWTFFGRAGRTVRLEFATSSSGDYSPNTPRLSDGTAELVAPDGTILSGPFTAGTSVPVTLSTDGVYKMRVRSGSTGNYTAVVWDTTTDVRTLEFNRPLVGTIDSPFSKDQWTFVAEAGRQISFDIHEYPGMNIQFDLTGPNGWVGFNNRTTDFELFNLPYSGQYVLTAQRKLWQYGADYGFEVEGIDAIELQPDIPYEGTFAGSGQAQPFRISLTTPSPMVVKLDDLGDTSYTELYAKLGTPPTRADYDYRAARSTRSDQQLVIPQATSQTWYFLVYANYVPFVSDYTLLVELSEIALTGVVPDHHGNGADAQLTISGVGFDPGTVVKLIATDDTVYVATATETDSSTQITATFAAGAVPAGVYDLRARRGDGLVSELTGAFEVTEGGEAILRTNIVSPGVLGYSQLATLYIEYENAGDVAMPAPMLDFTVLQLQRPLPTTEQAPYPKPPLAYWVGNACDGSGLCDSIGLQPNPFEDYESWLSYYRGFLEFHYDQEAILTLDKSLLALGHWTTADPEGFSNSISIFASGETPGLLQPGESGRVPVYWAGWSQPWNLSYPNFEFSLVETTTSSLKPIGWEYYKDEMRPQYVSPAAWEPVWQNLVSQIGATWGEYVASLDENAEYLGRLGHKSVDAKDLLALDIMQNSGAFLAGSIEQTVDLAVDTPGLPLAFGRALPGNLFQRSDLGSFGRGWNHNWELRLQERADGTILLFDSGLQPRTFQPDVRGGYLSDSGELGSLVHHGGGIFSLTEIGGTVFRFRADGLLNYVKDANSNRITAAYNSGRLVSLTHSIGASLTFEYTAAGLLKKTSSNTGGEVNYTYDTTGEHLISVAAPRGTTVYTYAPVTTGPKTHALESIKYPGNIHRYFSYDTLGRLKRSWRDDNTEVTEIAYAAGGEVQVTQLLGTQSATTRLFFDHRGTLARVIGPLERTQSLGFDDEGIANSQELPGGIRTGYEYDSLGNLVSLTDPLGQISFSYGVFNQLSSVTDARSNSIEYTHDPATGNLTAIIYEDGLSESYTFAPDGSLASWTNRRGQSITFSNDYYPDGRLREFQQVSPDGELTYSYTYGVAGDNLVVTDETTAVVGQMTFDHDTGLLERVEYPGSRSLEYSHYASGLRQQMIDQDGNTVNYTYDGAGRLDQLTDAASDLIVDYDYDVAGRLVLETLGNGAATEYQYDVASQLTHIITTNASGIVISRFDYTYDDLGQRISMNSLDGLWSYEYDDNGQLVLADFASVNPAITDQELRYEYDATGNRTRTTRNGVAKEYVTDNMNRYLSVGGKTYQYDADGNLISEIDGSDATYYEYDSLNRLVTVVTPSGTWEYEYDAFGNRDAIVHNGDRTTHLNDPTELADVVAEYDDSGNVVAIYAHGHQLSSRTDGTGSSSFYSHDALGSTAAVLDEIGEIANRYTYDPFGNPLFESETVHNDFQFVGGYGVMKDESGVSFMRGRYYESSVGRFVNSDPIGLRGLDTNLYRYVGNNPISKIDPSGRTRDLPPYVVGYPTGPSDDFQPSRNDQWDDIVDWDPVVLCQDLFFISGGIVTGAFTLIPVVGPFIAVIPAYLTYKSQQACVTKYSPKNHAAPPPISGKNVANLAPRDPNQKLGPGFGEAGYVTGEEVLSYRVDFENDASATAPAQFVLVTDQLAGDLDWPTFELTEIGFGDELVSVPAGSQHFETVVPMTYNDRDFEVHVSAGVNVATGEIRALFMTIDPDSGLPPDVLTGFLPPEDGTGRGQGYFSYTIDSVSGLPTGTEIRNIATIQFDFGEIIDTNQVDPHDPSQGTDPAKEALVTIDAGAPSSAVLPLSATVPPGEFTVSWTGEDDTEGSGIEHYDIYFSTDGNPFELLIGDVVFDAIVFPGELGHSYAFYSIATDNVGHVESAPITPDAVTVVGVSNSPPVASAGGPYEISEGDSLSLDASASFDPDGDPIFITWDLNADGEFTDATGPTPIIAWTTLESLGLGDNGTFVVSARVADDQDESNIASVDLVINNAAPTANLSNDGSVNEGSSADVFFGGQFDPAEADTTSGFRYAYDYGNDGSFEVGDGTYAGSGSNAVQTVPASLLDDGPGSLTVLARIIDKDGGFTDYTTDITVANVTPTASLSNDGPAGEGSTADVSFSSQVDPSAADTLSGFIYSYDFDNDGLFEITGSIAASATVPASYLDDGPDSHTIKARIEDKDGGFTDYTTSITVNNIAPTLSDLAATPIVEDGTTTLSGTISDAGVRDTFTVEIDWTGDGLTDETFLNVAAGAFGYSHQYLDDDPTATPVDNMPISMTVTDNDGAGVDGDTSVEVANANPNGVTINMIGAEEGVFPIGEVAFAASFADVGTLDTHTALWTFSHMVDLDIVSAERAGTIAAGGGTLEQLDNTFDFADADLGPGVYTVILSITDDDTGQTESEAQIFAVYDPSAGFVTGGGWIQSPEGALIGSDASGKASFGFVSKYKKGAVTPTGQTEFRFKAGDFNFHSNDYEWLVVAGARAMYKGNGTVNGSENYGFLLTAIDEKVAGGGEEDRFRIKIWDKDAGDQIVYDNEIGADDDTTPSTTLGGGSIVIHNGGNGGPSLPVFVNSADLLSSDSSPTEEHRITQSLRRLARLEALYDPLYRRRGRTSEQSVALQQEAASDNLFANSDLASSEGSPFDFGYEWDDKQIDEAFADQLEVEDLLGE